MHYITCTSFCLHMHILYNNVERQPIKAPNHTGAAMPLLSIWACLNVSNINWKLFQKCRWWKHNVVALKHVASAVASPMWICLQRGLTGLFFLFVITLLLFLHWAGPRAHSDMCLHVCTSVNTPSEILKRRGGHRGSDWTAAFILPFSLSLSLSCALSLYLSAYQSGSFNMCWQIINIKWCF